MRCEVTRGLIYGAKLTLTRNITTYVKQSVTLTRNVKTLSTNWKILYCKAHKGRLKTEIYVLFHRLQKIFTVNLHPAMQTIYRRWWRLRAITSKIWSRFRAVVSSKQCKAFKNQAAVVQSMDITIHWLNLFPVDNATGRTLLVVEISCFHGALMSAF